MVLEPILKGIEWSGDAPAEESATSLGVEGLEEAPAKKQMGLKRMRADDGEKAKTIDDGGLQWRASVVRGVETIPPRASRPRASTLGPILN